MNKKTNVIRLILCVVVFGVLILSAFVNTSPEATGNSVEVGSYQNYVPKAESTAEEAVPAEAPAEEASAAETAATETTGTSVITVITNVNSSLNSIAWGLFMCLLLVGTGVFISIRTGFIQFRRFGLAFKSIFSGLFKKNKAKAKEGEITPFQALCTALAGTVGTGNIAGVTGAIVLGGPGAVFWMWVAAIFGMCTKYAEIVLAIKYREKNAKGEWVGGPMYYIKNGMGKGWGWLAVLFAVFGALAAFGIGAMTQVNTIAGSVVDAFKAFGTVSTGTETTIRWIAGIVMGFLCLLVVIGGIKRLGSITERLIPFMSILYIIGSLIVIICNIKNLGMVFGSIFQSAFTPEAAFGGVGGFLMMNALKRGVGRGVFSNEAGLGSAPIAHSASSEENPVKQGLYGIFEVFTDTIVICTLTSLVVLTTNMVPWGNSDLAGAVTTTNAFAQVFGSQFSSIFMAVSILFFAFSTTLSWSYYGSRCFGYLTKGKALLAYQLVYVAAVVVGATLKLSLVWDIADTLNGFMAIPNLIALLSLSGVVVKLTREHFKKSPLQR